MLNPEFLLNKLLGTPAGQAMLEQVDREQAKAETQAEFEKIERRWLALEPQLAKSAADSRQRIAGLKEALQAEEMALHKILVQSDGEKHKYYEAKHAHRRRG